MLASELLAEHSRIQQKMDMLDTILYDANSVAQGKVLRMMDRLTQRLLDIEYSLSLSQSESFPPVD